MKEKIKKLDNFTNEEQRSRLLIEQTKTV